MDPTVEQILAEYERRSADEAKIMHSQPEEFARRIDDFLISVGPTTGRMLHLLAIGANAQSILELGTSYGYSTIWLADAARATGGQVVSLELSQRKSTMRRRSSRAPGSRTSSSFASAARSTRCRASRDPSISCCSTCGRTCTYPASSCSIQS
jgi:predicted O-methyltransferase YrrM